MLLFICVIVFVGIYNWSPQYLHFLFMFVFIAAMRAADDQRVALLLISHTLHASRVYLVKFGQAARQPASHAAIIQSWQQYVLGPLIADDGGRTRFHTFLCGNPDVNAENASLVEAYSNILSGIVEHVTHKGRDYADQYTRFDACLHAMRRREAASSINFTHVIRGRPELWFRERVPPLASLNPFAISLRARAVVFAEPRVINRNMLSTQFRCQAGQMLTSLHMQACLQRAQIGKLDRKIRFAELLVDPSCASAATSELRARLRLAQLPACALYDDQFAMMPRHLADAYLELEAPGQPNQASFMNYASAYDKHAVLATYGPAPDPDAFTRVCTPYGVNSDYTGWASRLPVGRGATGPSWSDVFRKAFHGTYATASGLGGRHTFGAAACCEYRLTWRLHGRLTPVELVAFSFVGAGHPFLFYPKPNRTTTC